MLRDCDDLAPLLLARFAAEPVPDDLRAPELAGLARAVDDFLAVPPLDRFAAVERELVEDLRVPDDFPELLREGELPALPLLLLADPSIDHLPLITRCAASATASAISDPSLVALDTTLLAAWDALSAASRPASRIFLRAAGLAAMAAAAAVSPAASISLLIAALASLSTVLSLEFELEPDEDELEREPEEPDFEEAEREEPLRADFAIFLSPCVAGKDTSGPFRFPNEVHGPEMNRRR